MLTKKQNVVGTMWCWFGRQKWSHTRSQWIGHNRKIKEEEDMIHGSGRIVQEIFRR